jgi:hypothetical protein
MLFEVRDARMLGVPLLDGGAPTKGPLCTDGGLEHPASARVNRSAFSAHAALERMAVFIVALSFGMSDEIASEVTSAARDKRST